MLVNTMAATQMHIQGDPLRWGWYDRVDTLTHCQWGRAHIVGMVALLLGAIHFPELVERSALGLFSRHG